LNYVAKCKKFLTKMKLSIPKCASDTATATDSSGRQMAYHLYPSADQAIASTPLSSNVLLLTAASSYATTTDAGASVNITTAPNSLSVITAYDTSGFTTKCPYGTVVPEDPTHPRVVYVAGTGCANACRY
jgi:hypothetical protein